MLLVDVIDNGNGAMVSLVEKRDGSDVRLN